MPSSRLNELWQRLRTCRQGALLISSGLLAGLVPPSVSDDRSATSWVGIAPSDPITYVGVSPLLASIALLASYVPARRGTRVDPMVALRHE